MPACHRNKTPSLTSLLDLRSGLYTYQTGEFMAVYIHSSYIWHVFNIKMSHVIFLLGVKLVLFASEGERGRDLQRD